MQPQTPTVPQQQLPPPLPEPPRRGWLVRHRMWVVFGALLLIIAGASAGFVVYSGYWYEANIKPKSTTPERIRVKIESGSNVATISTVLEEKGVIRSAKAFRKYAEKNLGPDDHMQAGTYLFSPDQSVKDIVTMLVEGRIDSFNVTITPGQRLDQIKEKLIASGFDKAQVEAALTKQYDHLLLADKPATADLEGYIYPETYQISSETTPEQLLILIFDEFYKQLQAKKTIESLQAEGLNLYQGITLASIVQMEVSKPEEQAQVAQVFLSRLAIDMPLGADPTFKYAAYKLGVEPSVSVDSPYNTRLYKGIPPGPIANFNLSAIEAVAHPATTDYLYFVAGDDGTTHFSKTEAEHIELTRKYCTKLCQ